MTFRASRMDTRQSHGDNRRVSAPLNNNHNPTFSSNIYRLTHTNKNTYNNSPKNYISTYPNTYISKSNNNHFSKKYNKHLSSHSDNHINYHFPTHMNSSLTPSQLPVIASKDLSHLNLVSNGSISQQSTLKNTQSNNPLSHFSHSNPQMGNFSHLNLQSSNHYQRFHHQQSFDNLLKQYVAPFRLLYFYINYFILF